MGEGEAHGELEGETGGNASANRAARSSLHGAPNPAPASPGSFTMNSCQLCASSLLAKNATLRFVLSKHWLLLTGGKILPPGCLRCSREQALSASPVSRL